MIGHTISHYQILEKLGEGGMGEVYLAEDTFLGRKVALKFLSPALTKDLEARKRFIHEARSQAMLSHPNIATFHEAGEEQNRVFLVMEYVEGQPLSDLAQKEKLTLPEALGLAVQIGEGLQAAHEKGVIHRDIKPENILVTPKRLVKLTDFGLAKWKGITTLTQSGTRMGTAFYMSPEQAEGRNLDERSDLFSLGVVLYQLISGKLPFPGEHEAAVIYAISYDQPEPLTRYKSGVPEELQRVVAKSLQKDPNLRYQSAADFVADLKRVKKELAAGEKRVAQKKMLAVLPFANLGAAEDEYFADGITDEIIACLARLSGLGIISRTSIIPYKKTDKKIRQIGGELGVDYLLEGTIRWSRAGTDQRLRISPQLIRVADDIHLWGEIYDAVLADVFELQSDIARKVTSALNVVLLDSERQALESRPTASLDAYDFYLRSKDYEGRGYSEENLRMAIEMYERAIQLDPNFASAYARASINHSALFWHYMDRTDGRLARAREAAEKARHLQPHLPDMHLAFGYYYYWGHMDYEHALEAFARAQALLPNGSDVSFAIGLIKRRQGKFEEAAARLKAALALDPRNALRAVELGITYAWVGSLREAEEYFDLALSLSPNWDRPYFGRLEIYLQRPDAPEKIPPLLQDVFNAGSAEDFFYEFSSDPPLLLEALFNLLYDDTLNQIARLPLQILRTNDPAYYFIFKALLCERLNQPEQAKAFWVSAKSEAEAAIQSRPNDGRYHGHLAVSLAVLGERERAREEGRRALELLPPSKDAVYGVFMLETLVQVLVLTGEYEEAAGHIEYLLTIPSRLPLWGLRNHPRWELFFQHPRLQKLLAAK